jgi:hypothetical protein
MNSTSYEAPHYVVFSGLPPLPPNILLSTLFSNTLSLRFSLSVSQVTHPYKTADKFIVLYILIYSILDRKREDKRLWTARI